MQNPGKAWSVRTGPRFKLILASVDDPEAAHYSDGRFGFNGNTASIKIPNRPDDAGSGPRSFMDAAEVVASHIQADRRSVTGELLLRGG